MKKSPINTSCQKNSANGLTLVEVLVSIAVVVLLAGVWIAAFSKAKPRSKRVNCVSNLKQLGLAFRMWSSDHDEKFPWFVSRTNGGTLEFAHLLDALPHYLAISNELASPKVLSCVADVGSARPESWHEVITRRAQLSYFVGLDADENKPLSILSGDRNLTLNGQTGKGIVTITNGMLVGWTLTTHSNAGNLGFGDGSAQQYSANSLRTHLQSSFTNLSVDSMRLVIP